MGGRVRALDLVAGVDVVGAREVSLSVGTDRLPVQSYESNLALGVRQALHPVGPEVGGSVKYSRISGNLVYFEKCLQYWN